MDTVIVVITLYVLALAGPEAARDLTTAGNTGARKADTWKPVASPEIVALEIAVATLPKAMKVTVQQASTISLQNDLVSDYKYSYLSTRLTLPLRCHMPWRLQAFR